jgi:hypothetical protein
MARVGLSVSSWISGRQVIAMSNKESVSFGFSSCRVFMKILCSKIQNDSSPFLPFYTFTNLLRR